MLLVLKLIISKQFIFEFVINRFKFLDNLLCLMCFSCLHQVFRQSFTLFLRKSLKTIRKERNWLLPKPTAHVSRPSQVFVLWFINFFYIIPEFPGEVKSTYISLQNIIQFEGRTHNTHFLNYITLSNILWLILIIFISDNFV